MGTVFQIERRISPVAREASPVKRGPIRGGPDHDGVTQSPGRLNPGYVMR
jgi:hypothetical protein